MAQAIDDLFETSTAAALRHAAALARLAGDIMDRNLYERANDCRWWALSPDIARLLAQPPSDEVTRELNARLDHLNNLYTVYAKLVVFDAQGTIRGASRESEGFVAVGRSIEPAWLAATERLRQSSQYAVSDFAPTWLYGDRPTSVYCAAIRGEEDGSGARGGIAIVFNSEIEFRTMLRDVVAGQEGAVAAFVDGAGGVVSCNDAAIVPGTADWALAAGIGVDTIVHHGQTYAWACAATAGYREFKISDGYRNGVRAIVALPLGKADDDSARRAPSELALQNGAYAGRDAAIELAVFTVGAGRYALKTDAIVEAVTPRGLARIPTGDPALLGLMEVKNASGRASVVQVLDANVLLACPAARRASIERGAVIVIRCEHGSPRPALGLWVDELNWVHEFDPSALQPTPAGVGHHAPLVEALLRTGAHGGELLQVVSHDALCRQVNTARRAAGAMAFL